MDARFQTTARNRYVTEAAVAVLQSVHHGVSVDRGSKSQLIIHVIRV